MKRLPVAQPARELVQRCVFRSSDAAQVAELATLLQLRAACSQRVWQIVQAGSQSFDEFRDFGIGGLMEVFGRHGACLEGLMATALNKGMAVSWNWKRPTLR
jgi:hypothetical protein